MESQTLNTNVLDYRGLPSVVLEVQSPRPGQRLNPDELWNIASVKGKELTMLTHDRFANAYLLTKSRNSLGIEGAIVECGVWRGGCSAVMALAVQEDQAPRINWAFDSFEGLPKPGPLDGDMAYEKAAVWGGGGCNATLEEFRYTLFEIAGLEDKNINIRKGWFNETLPAAKDEIGPIAILRLDGDWYDSTMTCLNTLYDQVVTGGAIIIDDYAHWEGCKKAVDEFRQTRDIISPLIQTDWSERFWIKGRVNQYY